ncbi:hypothetical protein [Cystobacter fuscus]|uniref:hypothetical protein n=1 Tax=Cystobacter fuscus TaxID=43 RepID=UPI002B2C266C|nr:hypothetical protein F0U63_43135 [Cystobacter fuscus]
MMSFTVSELIELCRQYYPTGRTLDDHLHETSSQWQRFHAKWHEALADQHQWLEFRRRVAAAFPTSLVGDATAYTHDGGYRCCIYAVEPRDKADGVSQEVVGCVSLLAPVYFIYCTQHRYRGGRRESPADTVFLEEMPVKLGPTVSRLADLIESALGCQSLPPHVARTLIPDLCLDHIEPGHASLFKALFTLEPNVLP